MAGRRGNYFYLGLIAFVVAAGWLGVRIFGTGPGRPFSEGDLAAMFREIELKPIALMEIDFDVFRSTKRFAPIRAQVRHADEMELALVHNRNELLTAAESRVLETP
ncbi:MAG: hypothetical protein U0900_17675 [Myxococcota bacterium]